MVEHSRLSSDQRQGLTICCFHIISPSLSLGDEYETCMILLSAPVWFISPVSERTVSEQESI